MTLKGWRVVKPQHNQIQYFQSDCRYSLLQAKKAREKEEAEKWKNVPVWKRKLMEEKEKEKQQKDAVAYQQVSKQ